MSIADKITRLQAAKTAIGTAITAKGGTVAVGDGFEDFAADVGTIQSQHIPDMVYTWQRPTDFPNLDALYDDNFKGILWSVVVPRQNNIPYMYHPNISFRVNCTGGVLLEIGTVQSDAFVVKETQTLSHLATYGAPIPSSYGDYLVYRLTPVSTSVTSMRCDMIDIDDGTYINIVEMYFVGINIGYVYSNTRILSTLTQHVRYEMCKINSVYSACAGNEIRFAEFVNCDFSGLTDARIVGAGALTRIDVTPALNAPNITTGCFFADTLLHIDMRGWNLGTTANIFGFANSRASYINAEGVYFKFSGSVKLILYNMYALVYCDVSGLDLSEVTSWSTVSWGMPNLVYFNSPSFYCSTNLSDCKKLTHDSLMSVINKLATVQTTQTLTLGSTNLAKLTSDEIAVATAKGWTVA